MTGTQITITEESHRELIDVWYQDAKKQTMETIGPWLNGLMNQYNHDYGTVCHAIAAGMIGAMRAMNYHPQGGITGFQAQCIMWTVIPKAFTSTDGPMRLVQFEDLLYPQYEERFTTISEETFKWVQERARNLLNDTDSGHVNPDPAVRNHWKELAAGKVPFGLKIEGHQSKDHVDDASNELGQLLNHIHNDHGQYVAVKGWKKAAKDALSKLLTSK